MNCKEGEMAFIVRSDAGNEGKIVTCVKYLGRTWWRDNNGITFIDHTWRIDRKLPAWSGKMGDTIRDKQLRPIRPGDLHETTDERKEVTA